MEKKVIVECYNESEKLLIEAIVVDPSLFLRPILVNFLIISILPNLKKGNLNKNDFFLDEA